jgi:predicted nucleotidyltransferase/biotin operon repressor
MDFAHPFRVVSPTLDGDVLAVLARAEEAFSGRQIHRLLGHGSEAGVRKAAERLVEQGIVLRSSAGRAKLYRLNREHLSAEGIELIAAARSSLVMSLRDDIGFWQEPPLCVVLFGSVARREAGPRSDIDLLVVRPTAVKEDSPTWRNQLGLLERAASRWTGNDARIVELGEDELTKAKPLLEDVLEEGIEVFGSLRAIRRAMGRGGG